MRVIVNGACGHMGMEVIRLAEAGYRNSSLAAAVDRGEIPEEYYGSLADFQGEADVIVDFSHHSAIREIMDYACSKNMAVVVATTGHDEQELACIRAAAAKIPVFHSANMSVGVALLAELAVKTAQAFPDADIEIVETHHNRKLDAPSGTALMLAEAIRKVRTNAVWKMGRSGQDKREQNEIGIHAVRRGNIVGIHEILVSTATQTITLKHEAHSRALFAEGAMAAAQFITGKEAGLYTMQSMI